MHGLAEKSVSTITLVMLVESRDPRSLGRCFKTKLYQRMRGALVVECTPCKLKTWNQPLAYKGAIKVMDKKIQSFKLQRIHKNPTHPKIYYVVLLQRFLHLRNQTHNRERLIKPMRSYFMPISSESCR